MKDAHDPREFRQWITFADDGSVAAVHEFAADVEQPLPTAVEVSALGPQDFTALKVDPALIADRNEALAAVNTQIIATAAARGDVLVKTAKITDALTGAIVAVKAQPTPITPNPIPPAAQPPVTETTM